MCQTLCAIPCSGIWCGVDRYSSSPHETYSVWGRTAQEMSILRNMKLAGHKFY